MIFDDRSTNIFSSVQTDCKTGFDINATWWQLHARSRLPRSRRREILFRFVTFSLQQREVLPEMLLHLKRGTSVWIICVRNLGETLPSNYIRYVWSFRGTLCLRPSKNIQVLWPLRLVRRFFYDSLWEKRREKIWEFTTTYPLAFNHGQIKTKPPPPIIPPSSRKLSAIQFNK